MFEYHSLHFPFTDLLWIVQCSLLELRIWTSVAWLESSLPSHLTIPFPWKFSHLLTDEATDTSAGFCGGREGCQNSSVLSTAADHAFIGGTFWLKEGKDSPFFYSSPNKSPKTSFHQASSPFRQNECWNGNKCKSKITASELWGSL